MRRTSRACWSRRASSARTAASQLLDAAGLGLGYRESVLKAAPDGSPDVVTQVTFELQPEDPAVITARLDDIRRWRQAHQPLGMPSAGSTFRNPEGDSAGRLIESVGLKGAREGGASVSEKHANFLVNDQGGSATDVRRLGDRVRATVKRGDGHRPALRDRVRGRLVRLAGAALMAAPSVAASRRSAQTRSSLPPMPIAVLIGGPSAEHDVSLVSGRAVVAALQERGHTVECWLLDLQGGWWRLPQDALDPAIAATAYDDPVALGAAGPLGAAAALEGMATAARPPVVFPALHGPFGEDGTIQALVGAAGLVCCGSGTAASAIGMDKTLFKRIATAVDLPVLPWVEIRARDWAERQS